MSMRYPNTEMLLYIGMADAYCAGVEYLKFPRDNAVKEAALRFERYIKHPTHDMQYAAYTDDTEMSVANARVLIHNDPPYTPVMFADEYVREFNRGGRRNGYARSFQQFLCSVTSGEEFLAKIQPYSRRNGAAMRSVPLGVLPSLESVKEAAAIQASVTHHTTEGIFSSQAVALMSHFALYEHVSLREVGDYCMTHLAEYRDTIPIEKIFREPWPNIPVHQEPYGCEALTTVHAVVDLLARAVFSPHGTLLGILERIIQWGGDTDTVAAIAWGIVSAHYAESPIPSFMDSDLEGGSATTGTWYLVGIGEQLMKKFGYNM